MDKNWNDKKTQNKLHCGRPNLLETEKVKKTEEKEKSKPTPILLG